MLRAFSSEILFLTRVFAAILMISCGTSESNSTSSDTADVASAELPNECGEIGPEGCCSGSTLFWCDNGVLKEAKCAATPLCGWNSFTSSYDCGTDGAAEPTGTFPWACSGSTSVPLDIVEGDVPLTDAKEGDLNDVEEVKVPSDLTGDQEIGLGSDVSADAKSEVFGLDIEPETSETDWACTPDCTTADGTTKVCGSDGCGGSCGSCPPGIPCIDGQCPCDAEAGCVWNECGPDGCGGYCGSGNPATEGCYGDEVCQNGICQDVCIPNCGGKQCGPDGCYGSCGTCPCFGCPPGAISCEWGLCQVPVSCDCKCIFDCFDTCPDGDQACFQNCVNSATIEAQMAYNTMMVCLDQAGYWDCNEDDDECQSDAWDACMDEYYECFHGDLSCADMYNCLMDCPAGDSDCTSDCYANGSVDALYTWADFTDCLKATGYYDCPAYDDLCKDAALGSCDAQFNACLSG